MNNYLLSETVVINRLKIWREMFVIPSKNINEDQPADLDETIKDYNYDNPHDSQNFIPEQYEVRKNI